jgi:hypothetical protein
MNTIVLPGACCLHLPGMHGRGKGLSSSHPAPPIYHRTAVAGTRCPAARQGEASAGGPRPSLSGFAMTVP